MSASFIHGFRVFGYAGCLRTGQPVLRGQAGQHLHNRTQQRAECRGISGAMWMTEAARDFLKKRGEGGPKVPHEEAAPNYDCTCGHYFYRTYKDAWVTDSNAYAHVTCLERTMLHTSGGRTTQYTVDYLLAPSRANWKVYIPISDVEQAQGKPVSPIPSWGPYGVYALGMGMVVERDQREVLEEIALSLGVPILERDDLRGCPICLVVNSWRGENEITYKMKCDWFGEGYKPGELDMKRHFAGEED